MFESIETTRSEVSASRAFGGNLILRVERGPARGRTLAVDDATTRVHIGRNASCELPLDDAAASRRHAAIEIVDGSALLYDLESSNGTLLDGVRIVSAFLHPGQTLRIGDSEITVESDHHTAMPSLPDRTSFGRLLGASREMRRLYLFCERLARTDSPVLIEGETGTGKEVVAESLHLEGPRRDRPFVVFDCTTVTRELLESELFGHERGAFTGAVHASDGLLAAAAGGTLFIDEIGDLDLTMQPKLLRAIERREYRRVGGTKTLKADVRLLFATRRDLDKEVQAGRFRDDLYHRIAVIRVTSPPLVRRRGDIPLLVAGFARTFGRELSDIPAHILRGWERHSWPGNVRELRNAVARFFDLGDLAELLDGVESVNGPASTRDIGSSPLESVVSAYVREGRSLAAARLDVIHAFERQYLEQVLAKNGGSVAAAARESGIAHRHFNRLLAKIGIGGR